MSRPLWKIASEIRSDWQSISPYAKPYLDAFATLDNVTQSYGCDDAKSCVLYFLSNASSWRGETAKRIKAELKEMVK